MAMRADPTPRPAIAETSESSRRYGEGIAAGFFGAATLSIWFLILDTIHGQPLYTPSVLGTALFRHGAGLQSPDGVPVSLDMVLAFTWVHFLVFGFLGGLASHLIAIAEQRPNVGFGVILFFVVLEFGFIAAAMTFAQPLLHALSWAAVLVGNLLAAAAMAAYLWHRHPNLRIEP